MMCIDTCSGAVKAPRIQALAMAALVASSNAAEAQRTLIRAGRLLGPTLAVPLVPTVRASRVSPTEAIRCEQAHGSPGSVGSAGNVPDAKRLLLRDDPT